MAMMVILAAVLLTYGVSTGIAMKIPSKSGAVAGEHSVLPPDMVENSVDDMYFGCEVKMKKKATQYLKDEKNKDKNFKEVWDSTEKYVLDKFKKGRRELVAIYYYTSGKNNAYRDFNDKVRTQGPEYKTKFGYHALHFYLTTAILTLQKEKKMNKECLTGYRRVDGYFSQDVKNKEIRFGAFTSASMGRYLNNNTFGDKSCFQIFTCMGADISRFSFYNESEVLIPPYEVFKVVEIKKRTMQSDLPCEVVYKVKSTGAVSRLNCALITK